LRACITANWGYNGYYITEIVVDFLLISTIYFLRLYGMRYADRHRTTAQLSISDYEIMIKGLPPGPGSRAASIANVMQQFGTVERVVSVTEYSDYAVNEKRYRQILEEVSPCALLEKGRGWEIGWRLQRGQGRAQVSPRSEEFWEISRSIMVQCFSRSAIQVRHRSTNVHRRWVEDSAV